jgi:hypothetical protein
MPYRLYALSNLASMLALLSYPVLVEPYFLVHEPGHGLVGRLCAVRRRLRAAPGSRGGPCRASARAEGRATSRCRDRHWRECLLWIGLAMTASLLLLAMTRHLTQDVAPVPFLWVLPLSIYLLSFILCFDAPRYYYRPLFLVALPLAFLVLDRIIDEGGMEVPAGRADVGVAVRLLHGLPRRAGQRRPPVRHLTLFYLMLSIGGALGGTVRRPAGAGDLQRLFRTADRPVPLRPAGDGVLWREPATDLAHLLVWRLLATLADSAVSIDYVENYRVVVRNFYSQLRVDDATRTALGMKRRMVHGRINHGEQFLAAEHRRTPTAYYCEESGVGQALRALPQERPLKLGMLGLGAGTLATYGRSGDELRMYEINEQVLDLARSEFSYLGDSPATHRAGAGRRPPDAGTRARPEFRPAGGRRFLRRFDPHPPADPRSDAGVFAPPEK